MRIVFLLLLACFSRHAGALPIGFGVNQGDLEYKSIDTPHFYIYHDARVPHEGAMTANALEAARPLLETWLGRSRTYPLPVISSAITENASFANFITDAIELQTKGQGARDLFWHEYVHATMYLHLHNFLGPAGAMLHLPWMPAWFIEGLAEALSVSVGSDVQASLERHQALSGDWPSYDKLHSLYSQGNFFEQGYGTSGAFAAWLLRKGGGEKLPKLLQDFYDYTWPQYYFLTVNPFSYFMPFDEALTDFAGSRGELLYAQYRKEAEAYWRSHAKGRFLSGDPGERFGLSPRAALHSDGESVRVLYRAAEHEKRRFARLDFDSASGWARDVEMDAAPFPAEWNVRIYDRRPGVLFGAAAVKDGKSGLTHDAVIAFADGEVRKVASTRGDVLAVWGFPGRVAWVEQDLEYTRLCFIAGGREVACPIEAVLPKTVLVLGVRTGGRSLPTEIWLAIREQALTGDTYQILAWNTENEQTRTLSYEQGAIPLQLAQAGDDLWLLVGEHNRRSVQHIDGQGRCRGVFALEDYVLEVAGLNDGSLVFGLFDGPDTVFRRLPRTELRTEPCYPTSGNLSPLLAGLRAKGPISLAEAMQTASLWQDSSVSAPVQTEPFDKAVYPEQDAPLRTRYVASVPWIGADDYTGLQLGILSVPLMDHLQNETLRATLLYGPLSRYPAADLTLESTRFWPTLDASVFRRQVWDGNWLATDGQQLIVDSLFYDELGTRFAASFPWHVSHGTYTLSVGLRSSVLKPYVHRVMSMLGGALHEPFGSASFVWERGIHSFNASLKLRGAPVFMNPAFEYSVLSGSVGAEWDLPFLQSTLSGGVDYARTNWKANKAFHLKEFYQPLKTFVPGSGGGYNQNSINLLGDGSLFFVHYGDRQARAKLHWTLPLIDDIAKQAWLFYFESLNFSAFLNYGGAWLEGTDWRKALLAAHGYNLDLLFENKGVHFNTSLGTGQVFGREFQLYLTLGFDAIL